MAKGRPELQRPVYLPSPTSDEVHYRGKDDSCCGVEYLKHVLYVFNFFLLVSGCVVLAIGLWTLFVKHSFVSLLATNIFTITAYLLIITGGIIIVFVFILGCVGACWHNCCLLMTFAAFLMLVFMLEAIIGAAAYLYETAFRCCGAGNYTDWYYRPNSTMFPSSTVEPTYKSCESYAGSEAAFTRPDWVFSPGLIETDQTLPIPESCCLSPCSGCSRRPHPSNIFTSGCVTSLEHYFSDHLIIIGAIGLGLCTLQIFGIIFSCCLAKKIRRWREQQKTYWR